jgi:O-antigen/teichoic acid export membrane protein
VSTPSDHEQDAVVVDPGLAGPELAPAVSEETLDAVEVRRRAAGGAILVALRGAGIQIMSFGANIVVARLVAPHEYGLIALGNTILVFGDMLATGGASQTLVRHERPPELDDLRAVTGFQVAVSSLLALVVAGAALPLGRAGALAAVMASAMPLLAFRTAPAVMMERSLAYSRLVTVELVENVIYYLWVIGTVLAGWGVWGLATGVLVRVAAGTSLLNMIGPVGWVRPTWSWDRLRPILGFGLRLQGASAANFVRDQLFNVVVAAESGFAALGLWSLAARAISVPTILFAALWRVSFPGMSRLLALGEDVRDIVERSLGMVGTAAGAALCPVVASAAALVPAVFGARWGAAADALPGSCFGLMIVGPISVASGGFLSARGDAGTILRGAIWHTFAQFVVAIPLLPFLHLWAIGLAFLAASLVEATVLGRRAKQHTGVRLLPPILGPLVAATVGATVGWILATTMGPHLLVGVATGVIGELVFLLLMALLAPTSLMRTIRSLRHAVASVR